MGVTNPELDLVNGFVRHTSHNVFLTGKAGTGKTTFLHNLKADSPKRMIVTAPTGVAAINAGGVTLHSFFQLPLGPYVPGSESQQQLERHRFNREKINIIRSLDLLVIDEISMVRADLLDAVDAVLRRYRRSSSPFGGVQLLMIGDLHQLLPVVRPEEWEILRPHYNSCYFFGSSALRQTHVVSIELKHIYRQSDADFIRLLNNVRNNRMDRATLDLLNSRHMPAFQPDEDEGYITLTTHNRSADRINQAQLDGLDTRAFSFAATVDGDYPAHIYPTSKDLTLKQGAQVMFVRNDSSGSGLYFNGKIGRITEIGKRKIVVQCAGDPEAIPVERIEWENIEYEIDEQTRQISEKVVGRFNQYPLRLAWAITIHKSQGLTFERAIIDANAAFSPGQVYVALSRCKTFEGMVLSSPIAPRVIKTDTAVAQFVDTASRNPPTREQLGQAQIQYQQRLLLECWDFRPVHGDLRKLAGLLRDNRELIECPGIDTVDPLERQTLDQVVVVGGKFQRQLQSLFQERQLPEENGYLQERVRKASAYFTEKLQQGLIAWLGNFTFETDNKSLGKTLNRSVERLQRSLAVKNAGVKSCREGFSTTGYLQAVADGDLEFKSRIPVGKKPAAKVPPHEHPQLLQALLQWREATAEKEEQQGEQRHRILHRKVLARIAAALPEDQEALIEIQGIGQRTVERYGRQIMEVVSRYCRKHGIRPQSRHAGTAKKKTTQTDTKEISYQLYRQGNSIEEIAKRRLLKRATVESHLTHYIASGQLEVTEFVDLNRLNAIKKALEETADQGLSLAKERLGEEVSYGELRMVQASLAVKPDEAVST